MSKPTTTAKKETDDAVINKFIRRVEKQAAALREDGRTADGCSKSAAANNLDRLASDMSRYFARAPVFVPEVCPRCAVSLPWKDRPKCFSCGYRFDLPATDGLNIILDAV